MNSIHSGSNFDDFLKEEGLLADVEATAIKRVVAYQTLINETLKQAINHQDIESTLRRVIREELKKAA